MLDFSGFPISPELSRSARKKLSLTQSEASVQSGLPAYMLRAFEKGNMLPDLAFMEALRDFYEKSGVAFQGADTPGVNAKASGQLFPAGLVKPGDDGSDTSQVGKLQTSEVLHIRIDPTIEAVEIGRILDHIEHNEKTVAALLRQKVDKAQVRGLSDASEAIHGTVVRLLAENGTLLAKLFGRPLVEPKHRGKVVIDHVDLLAKTQDDMLNAIAGDRKAQARARAAKSPNSLKAAIFD